MAVFWWVTFSIIRKSTLEMQITYHMPLAPKDVAHVIISSPKQSLSITSPSNTSTVGLFDEQDNEYKIKYNSLSYFIIIHYLMNQ